MLYRFPLKQNWYLYLSQFLVQFQWSKSVFLFLSCQGFSSINLKKIVETELNVKTVISITYFHNYQLELKLF